MTSKGWDKKESTIPAFKLFKDSKDFPFLSPITLWSIILSIIDLRFPGLSLLNLNRIQSNC